MNIVTEIYKAATDKHDVVIAYTDRKGNSTERIVTGEDIIKAENDLLFVAFDKNKQEYRRFSFGNITKVEPV